MDDKLHEKWAKIILIFLIDHIKNFKGGEKYLFYGQLAKKVNYPKPHSGNLFGKNIGQTLGTMGRILEKIRLKNYKGNIPLLQTLVVSSSSKLPSYGLRAFNEEYDKISKDKQRDFVYNEYKNIFEFGNLWDDVLRELRISPNVRKTKTSKIISNKYGSEESIHHKKLKEIVSKNPTFFGFSEYNTGIIEYSLKSGDSIDVVFENQYKILGIEVKSKISGNDDLLRGLFQLIKYKAVLEAEQIINKNNKEIECILVIEGRLNPTLSKFRNKLGLTVYENYR